MVYIKKTQRKGVPRGRYKTKKTENNTPQGRRKRDDNDLSNSPNKRKIVSLQEHRRQRQKVWQDRLRAEREGRNIIEDVQEIQKIVETRKVGRRREFKVRWKGKPPSDDSWVFAEDLCNSAHKVDVKQFVKDLESKRNLLSEAERLLGITDKRPSKVIDFETTHDVELLEDFESRLPRWPESARTNSGEVRKEREKEKEKTTNQPHNKEDFDFQPVERININESNATERVKHARTYGIPVVLTGHTGWPQFANRWLKQPTEGPLDLAQQHEIDIEKMIQDIGEESVPILKKNYDEHNPIQREIFAKTFLEKCWPQNGKPSQIKGLYLHQWQFPMSESAAGKFCGPGRCTPLPNDILEEDILQYWLDRRDNPFQYIFMGDTDTMSKLHKDPGGLAITIAPIVGKKECILGHRDDGERCLYNLDVKLDDLDLDRFPMTAFARVWKTVICPGEILIMPRNTYHQCRNVTPCLSYHRFHLDMINIQAFLDSMICGDSLEMSHDEIIWNAATEMTDRVDKYVVLMREGTESAVAKETPQDVLSALRTLRRLRMVCQEIAIQFEQSKRNPKLCKNPIFLEKAKNGESHYWPRMVQDIEHTFHDFEHRFEKNPPKFKARRGRMAVRSVDDDSSDDDSSVGQCVVKKAEKSVIALSLEEIEECLRNLPQLQPFEEDLVISDSVVLGVGDKILVRLGTSQAEGKIVSILDQSKSFYVSYEGLSSCFDEYQLVENTKKHKDVPGSGEPSSSSHDSEEIGDGGRTLKRVYCHVGGDGEGHVATVQSSRTGTFYLVDLDLGKSMMKRLLCRDNIVGKLNEK